MTVKTYFFEHIYCFFFGHKWCTCRECDPGVFCRRCHGGRGFGVSALALLFLACAATARAEPDTHLKVVSWALRGVVVADAISTHVAIVRYGARETIIPSQKPWIIDGVLGAQAYFGTKNLSTLDALDHPKLARVIGWTCVALHAVAVANNVRQMRGAR